MKLTMFGTGNANVTECYNTCFMISDGDKNFMIDAGGGNRILYILKRTNFELNTIRNIFITHQHIDHLLGLMWIIRISAQKMNKNIFDGDLNIYSHSEVINLVSDLVKKLLLKYQADFVGKRIHLITVNDGEVKNIIGHEVKFFDIGSTFTRQFGFVIDDKKLVCCGDAPCHKNCEEYVRNCDWLLHEAFCLYSQVEIFSPYEKNHSTVKEAAELAERLNVRNLLLYHTEDSNLENRKKLYTDEAKKYFSGKIFVPDDLEILDIGE